MTDEEVFVKMQLYCAYQDRCHQEVRYKLIALKVYGDRLEEVMSRLIQEGYLSDERFARNFARGKYRMKQWGKLRIERELKTRQISAYCIKKAMEEIDEEQDYEETLMKVARKYAEARKGKYDGRLLRQKTYSHVYNKGFESNLILKALDRLAI